MNKKNNTDVKKKDGERLNITDAEPFSPLKIAELAVCLVAVIFGVLYLNGAAVPTGVMLAVFSACFLAVAVIRFVCLIRGGVKKPSAYFLAAVLAVLAVAMTALAVSYFVSRSGAAL